MSCSQWNRWLRLSHEGGSRGRRSAPLTKYGLCFFCFFLAHVGGGWVGSQSKPSCTPYHQQATSSAWHRVRERLCRTPWSRSAPPGLSAPWATAAPWASSWTRPRGGARHVGHVWTHAKSYWPCLLPLGLDRGNRNSVVGLRWGCGPAGTLWLRRHISSHSQENSHSKPRTKSLKHAYWYKCYFRRQPLNQSLHITFSDVNKQDQSVFLIFI